MSNNSNTRPNVTGLKKWAIDNLGLGDVVKAAGQESATSGLPGLVGGPADAYRHLLISAELVRQKGQMFGANLAKANEFEGSIRNQNPQSEMDERMDSKNNELAEAIGNQAKTWEDVVRLSREAIEKAAQYNGDGTDGTPVWYDKSDPKTWPADWKTKDPVSHSKAGEDHRSGTHEVRETIEDAYEYVTGGDDRPQETDAKAPQQNPADAEAGIPDTRPQTGNIEIQNGNKIQTDGSDAPSPSAKADSAPIDPSPTLAEPTAPATDTGPAASSFVSAEDAARFGEAIRAELSPDMEASLKAPADLSEAEIRRLVRRPEYGIPGHPDFKRLNDLVKDWHGVHYSNDPLRFDATGKMIRAEFTRTPPDAPVPLTTVEREPMPKARDGIATHLAGIAKTEGLPTTVRALQRGINLAHATEARQNRTTDPEPPLKTDGDLGPKTKLRLDREMARRGRAKLEETTGLGRLADLMEHPTLTRDPARLSKTLGIRLAPLFGTQTNGDTPPIVAETLQETINDTLYSEESPKTGPRRPLTLDGHIGPKTADALADAINAQGPDHLATRFGQRLGFL